jgi:hypothetical protein
MKSIALVKGQNGDNRDISNHPQKASGYRVVKPDINPTNPTSALNGGKGAGAPEVPPNSLEPSSPSGRIEIQFADH